MKILFSHYRIERKWPSTSWRWVPEDEGLTLQRAQAKRRYYRQWPEMKTRMIRTTQTLIS